MKLEHRKYHVILTQHMKSPHKEKLVRNSVGREVHKTNNPLSTRQPTLFTQPHMNQLIRVITVPTFCALSACYAHKLPRWRAKNLYSRRMCLIFDFLACIRTSHLQFLVPYGGREIPKCQFFLFAFVPPTN